MMGITPNYGFAQNGWGNSSWSSSAESNYGFWALYRTELTQPGQLSVGSVGKITEDYNNYGIYAGVATRIEDLQTSAYIDVNVRKTGCVQTYAIDVDYGESTEVPFYRIHPNYNAAYGAIYTAEQINANRTLNLSDVKDGDELIWVYNKDQNRIAFVVDLGGRNKADGDSINYTSPAWLTTLYNAILVDENSGTAGAFDAEKLLADAKAVDEKADATAQEVNDMIARMEAAKDKTMTVEQAGRYNTLLTSLKAKALPLNKNAALLAAQNLANEILLNGDASSAIKTPVSTALSTLTTAITSAGNAAALELIWKNGEFVPTQADVKGLKDAIALANAQISAIAVAAKAVTDAGLTVADAGISTAYTTLVGKIEACTKITQTPPTATDVEYYVKDGKLTNVTESAALVTAINTTAGTAAMTKAVADAKTAADKVAAGCETLVADELTALKNAIDTYAASGATAAEKLALLNAIAADNWNAAVGTGLWAPYQALLQAVADNKADAEANAEFDNAVKPDEGGISGGNNATPAPGGSSYGDAYNAFGVNVSYTSDGVSITVDRTKMAAVMTNPALYTPNITTMVNQGTLANISNSSSAVIPLFVGAHFDVPVEAKSMKRAFVEGTPSDDPATLVSSKTAVARTADLSGDFNPSGMNNWYQIGTVKATKDASGNVTFSEVTVVQTPVEYMYVQFFKSNDGAADSEIGSILRFVGSVQFVG